MKKKFVRLISAVLSAVMTLTAVPLSAFAEGEGHTHDGESNVITEPLDFREKTADENGVGWSWDYDTMTLTLNGVNIQATTEENMMSVVTVPDGTEIVLNGNNTIVQTDTGKSDTYVLSAVNNKEVNCDGTMTISGDGVLNAENRSTDSMARSLGGSIILNGGTVNATGTVKTNSLEIHNEGVLNANATTASFEGVAVNVSRGITVDGNGSLTAVGSAVENEYANNGAILLNSNFGDKISVSGNGSITVPEGNAARVGIYYSGNNSGGMNAEISGGKVTAYGTKYGIYNVNLIMSGTGSVYTTGGSYAIGQTSPAIDENRFTVKGSTEFKAEESAVTGEVKNPDGYYYIGGADAKTVVIKPDTSPRIILGKQTGIFKTEEYEIIEGIDMTDTKLKGTVYFDITLKNMSDEEFADARGYFGGDEPDLLASIIKTDYGWVCMVCDTEFSTTYDTDNTLTIKCGDIVSNTVQVKSNANRFNKVTQGDNTNRTVFYTNTSQEEKDNYKLVSTYTVDSESISYNWYSTNSAYSADELGAAVSGSNGEFKLADNIPAGNYVLYCDITYSDGDSTETVTEKFTFTYKECAHENGYSDGKCTNCGALCDHSNIDINTGKCNECAHQFVATISTDGSAPTGYGTLAECLDSITADTGNYVKIYQDIGDAAATTDTVINVNHNVMVDLNGHKLNNIKLRINKDVKLTLTGTEGSYVDQVYVRNGGSFVIDSDANVEFDTIFVEAGAQLTVSEGAKVTAEQLSVKANTTDDGATTTSVKLATGMKIGGLTYVRQDGSGLLKFGNLLDVTRQALQYDGSGKYVDLYEEFGSKVIGEALTVVEHNSHKYSSETGACEECGKPCEHGGDISTDNGKCSICGKVCGAVVIKADGTAVGYDGLAAAFAEAGNNNGCTLKLFSYYDLSEDINVSGEFTIDLNKKYIHCLNSSKIIIGKNAIISLTGNAGSNISKLRVTGGTLTVLADCSVLLDEITVQEGKLNLYSGRVESLHIEAGADIALYGGYIRDVFNDTDDTENPILLRSLLADGYAFATEDDNGAITVTDVYDSTISVFESINLYVVEHKTCSYDKDNPTGKCKECGKPCEHGGDINTDNGICSVCGAVVSVALYTDANGNLYNVDADGLHNILTNYYGSGTVKLFKDYSKPSAQYDLYGELTIDVNGHKLSVRSITPCNNGKLTIKNSGKKVTFGCNAYPTSDPSYAGGTLIIDGNVVLDTSIYVYDSSTVILKDGTYPAGLYARDSKTLYDMLGEGKAFFKADGTLFNANVKEVTTADGALKIDLHPEHTYVDGKCGCGYVCPHSDVDIDTGKCTECEYQYAAVIVKDDNIISRYKNTATELTEAFKSADSADNKGCTLKLFKKYTGDYRTLTGEFTLWLGRGVGFNALTVSENGNITVKNGKLQGQNFGDFTVGDSAKLTFGDKNRVCGTVTVGAGTFDCYDANGIDLIINHVNSNVTLYGGYFKSISYKGGGDRENTGILSLLAEKSAFYQDSELFDCSSTTLGGGLSSPTDVAAHNSHSYKSETGKCGCGRVCSHTDINTELGKCKTCQHSFVATLTAGDKTTGFDTLEDCLNSTSEDGANYVKVYQNIDSTITINVNNTVTVDLNGHRLNSISFVVNNENGDGNLTLTGAEGSYANCVKVCSGKTFKIDSSANICIETIKVEPGARFEVSNGANVTANSLVVDEALTSGGGTTTSVQLAEGMRIGMLAYTLDSNSKSGKLQFSYLLSEFQALRYDSSEYVDLYEECNGTFITDPVTVVEHNEHSFDSTTGKCVCGYPCPHIGYVNNETGVCKNCGYQLTAGISGVGTAKYFDNIDNAFTAALSAENNGCTLTLYKDCELSQNIVIGNATVTVDMNGHSILLAYRIKVNDGGVLYLKNSRENGSIDTEIEVNKGGTLINGTADDSRSAVSVFGVTADAAKRVEIYGGSYEGLTVNNGTSGIALYGGSYELINTNDLTDSTPVSALLAKGYAFAILNSVTHLPESIVDGSAKTIGDGLTNVMVVAHEHRYNVETGKCPCGVCALAIFTETTQSSETYTFIESETQFKNIAENEADGVLKLTGVVDCIVKGIIINGNKTIDMNGHTLNVSVGTEEISAVAVYGNVTFENSGSSRAVINATGVYSYGMVTVNGDIEFDTFATFEDGDALINAGVFKSIYVQGRSVIEILGSGKALASESGEILNASVQQIYKAGDNIFVKAHPKHTYDDHGNCACGYKCLHDGEGQVNEDSANKVCSECGAKIYAKVTTADGKVKYFDDITEGLRYADKAENKGCVFTLVTTGGLENDITLSSGQFTITAIDDNYINAYTRKINIKGAEITVENCAFNCFVGLYSGSLTYPEGSTSVCINGISVFGGTLNISDGVSENFGANKFTISDTATDAKVTIGGGIYSEIKLGQYTFKDILASGTRLISVEYSQETDEIIATNELLYSIVSEQNTLGVDDDKDYRFVKCDHKNEDGSYAFNEGGICKYCNSEFAASVSYTDGGEKTELFGDIYDAFDKANEIGTATVTLQKNITDDITDTIAVTGNVTLELNGKRLSQPGTDVWYSIEVTSGKLTVNGSGLIKRVAVCNGSNAEINGGTFSDFIIKDGGNAVIKGGQFYSLQVSGEGRNVRQLLADGYAYWSLNKTGYWSTIAEREKQDIANVEVKEAPIKSASIAWVGEEAPVIYRNGEKYLYVDITYELAVGSRGATYSDFVNGNNRIKDYNLYNKYMVHCYEIGKLAAKDGEVEYYIVLKCNGYEYKSNVLKLTLATCSHPEDSFSYENDGLVICGICDALIEAEVVDADGKSLGYADIESAIKLAQENEGSTVKLMSEGVSESITVTGGRFTVDFNGKKVFYQFDVNGGDVTFTSSVKQADVETLISGITVNGTDAKVTIDGKIKLGSVTLTSGTLAVNSTQGYIKELSIEGGKTDIDGAEIDTLVFKGGDLAIRNVTVGSLDINKKATDATEHNIVIESGSFDTITCSDDSDYNIVKALASERRLRGTESGIIYEYSEIESLTEATEITVEKCDHKYANGNIAVDDDYVCYYCNSQIVATVSYTADGSEKTDLFGDICDAFDKANEASTATVTLRSDITGTLEREIKSVGNITLDLNGKKLTVSNEDEYTLTVWGGTFTVKGDGELYDLDVFKGKAVIQGGKIKALTVDGTAVISGGEFECIIVGGGKTAADLLEKGYAYKKSTSGTWVSIADRENSSISSVTVTEAPIKSATITAEDESPIIYRNGRKVASFTADVTYTGNETLYVTGCLIDGTVIKEKTDLSGNRYYLFSGEVDKAVAEDGEIQYYCIFTYDGYDYKSNAVTLTVATCRHPSESVKCDDNGNYVCGICDSTLLASVELSDGTLSYYNNRNDAIGAAEDSEGCTLKLLSYSFLNYNETFDISKGRFTVDFNKDDGSGRFTFNVKGGDITFTTSQATSNPWARVQVSGENANVLIDSKARLNGLVVNSGKVTVDGANIGAITINGGDMVINDVDTGLLSEEGNGSVNISIVSGRFESVVFDEYTFGKAIASGSRIRLTDADGGKIYKYADIQNKGNAGVIVVEKCDHKDENYNYELDGKPCPYCNEEIAATVSYTTANGGEQTDLFSDIYDAFERANERGTATITLYKDIENSELTRGINVTGNVTLALNGKKLGGTFAFNAPVEVSDGGMFTVGGDGNMQMPIIVNENAKLTVNGGEIATVMIYKDGDAVIGGGFIEDLVVNGNAKLSGGKFYNLEIANGSLESILADGYAYKVDGGAWLSIAERAKEKYYSWNNEDKPVSVEEAPIKSATLSTEINKLYRNSNANPTLKFNLALAHGSNLNDSYVSKRYGINSYVSGDIIYSSLSALVKDAKLSADEIIDKAGDSDVAEIYYVVTTGDGYEIKSNTVSIDLVDCDHSQVVDPTADKETAGNITTPTYCEICKSKFNAKITKGDDVKYYNDLDEAAKDAQKSENEGCTLYPLYNKNGYGGQLVITEGNFTLKYAVRTAFSRPIIINGKAKLTVTGRCAVTAFENQDAFIVRGGDVTFDGLATGSNVTINGGNVTMASNNINCLTINGGNVSISSGGFAEIVTTVSDKVIADYIDPGFWVQDRGTKEWIDIYSLDKATASSTNVLTVRLCPMQIIKPIDTVYYTNGYYPGDIPSLQISAVPWYSGEVDAKVAYQWIGIDENGYETEIEGATDRKLSLENLTTGRYYCRITYSNATTAGVSMASDVVTATITECEHSGGEATCTNKAKCEICGAEYGETKPHSYAQIKSPEYLKSAATCTAKAVYYTSCTECGRSSKGTKNEATFEYGNALGHKYGEWVSNGDGTHSRVCANDSTHIETKACHGGKATCTAKAICEDCGKAYGEMAAHTFTAKTVAAKYLKSAATCTAKAVYYTSCADCGLSSKGTKNEATFEYGNALGHKYGEWVSNGNGTHTRVCANDNKHTETKACHGGKATCTAKAICEVCGKAYGEMAAHTFTAKTASAKYLKSAATCTAKAVYYTSCADCGLSSKGTKNEATFEYGNALGHKYGKWVSNGDGTHTRVCANDNKHTETKNCHGGKATCTAKAICEDCGKAYGKMTAHTFTAKTTIGRYLKTAATCTTKSVYYTSCADCGLSSKGTASEAVFSGSALGHSLTAWSVTTEATCTTNGSQERHCTRCDYKQTKTITAKGHEFGSWKITKNVSCLEDGEQSRVCSVCKKTEVKKIAATGVHTYGAWKVTKKATCTATGVKERTCTSCGAKEKITLKATGHKYVTSTVKPTYTSKGYTLHKCSVCGSSYKSNYTATLVLAPISGLKRTARTNTTVTLSWNKHSAADGYIVERYNGKTWVRVAKISKNSTTSYTVKSLTPSTTNKFRVKAYKSTASSAYSYVTVNTLPNGVTGFKATSKTSTTVTLSWNKNSSAGGYIIEYYNGTKWVQSVKISGNATVKATVKGIAAGKSNKLRIKAYKVIGSNTVYSAYTQLTVKTKPTDVTGLKAVSKTNNTVKLQWNKNTSADSYIIEKYSGNKWVQVTKISGNATTSYTVSRLKSSTTYRLRIKAVKSGEYSNCTYINVTTKPYAVNAFKAKSISKSAITLQWNKNTSADGYCIEKYNGTKWVQVKRYTSNASTTYTLKSLKAGTTYKFRIRAYKTVGKTTEYSTYTYCNVTTKK